MYEEAQFVSVEVHLVKEGKLQRYQRRNFKVVQGKLFALWEKFEEKKMTAEQLLKAVLGIYGPCS